MKKLMTLMLGMSFLVGTVSMFAQDTKTDDAAKTTKKAKKAKKAKKSKTDKMDDTKK